MYKKAGEIHHGCFERVTGSQRAGLNNYFIIKATINHHILRTMRSSVPIFSELCNKLVTNKYIGIIN